MPDLNAIKLAQACGINLPDNAPLPGNAPVANGQPEPAAVGPCDFFAGSDLADGWPMPGSERFCIVADKVGADFAGIFDRVIAWLDDANPVDAIAVSLGIPLAGGAAGIAVNGLIGLWNEWIKAAQKLGHLFVDRIVSVWRNALNLYRCAAAKCNSGAYLGVWSLWQMARILRDLDIGWELGPKLTISIEFDFPGLNEWLEALMRFYCPTEAPSAGEATEAWLLGRISKDRRDCVWRLNGHDPESFEAFALTGREQLDWREAIQYVRRLGGGVDNENDVLRARGFVDAADVNMAREMYWELPGIADHLHWLQRQVFDTDYVKRYELMTGFEDKFWPEFGRDLTALGMRKHYAELHYAAHWIQPAPQQMQEFLYRSDEIVAAGGKPFTLDDYERLLAEQDYAPLARKWFTATAYNVPAISYVKAMYQQGIINDDALRTYHARLGYAPEDAARFASIDRLQKDRMRAAASGGWTTKTASTAWVRGKLTEAAHNDIFRHLGYTQAEASEARKVAEANIEVRIMVRAQSKALTSIASSVNTALHVGVMTEAQASKALTDVGWPVEFADGYVRTQNALAGIKVVQQGITFLRRRVTDGSITFADAAVELQRFGVTPQAAQRYLQTWALEMTPGRKHRSAAQIASDLAKGHIQAPEAVVRLRNLGYDDADTRLYLADAQGQVQSIKAKKDAADAKTMAQRQKALTAVAKQAAALKKEVVKSMVRDMPVTKLEKWLKKGYISKGTFTERMRLYGFSADDIALRIREQCEAKGAACTDAPTDQKPGGAAGASGVAAKK